MNIEGRMLVKYGIPGWFFALNVFISFKFIGVDLLKITGLTSELFSSVILIVLGIPIGYVLYQIYFITTHKDHKYSTPDWNVFVYTHINVEDREYVIGRYEHMLRKIHETGVLRISIVASIVVIYIPTFYILLNVGNEGINGVYIVLYGFLNIGLWIAITKNYNFTQEELERYTAGIRKSL